MSQGKIPTRITRDNEELLSGIGEKKYYIQSSKTTNPFITVFQHPSGYVKSRKIEKGY